MPDTSPTWYTTGDARRDWADAPKDNNTLADLLASAQESCICYGAGITVDAVAAWLEDNPGPIPATWRRAHLLEAIAQHTATQASPTDDQIGNQQTTVAVKPMSWQIRNLLRPSAGLPGVG